MKLTRQELESILKRNPSLSTETDGCSKNSRESPKLESDSKQKLVRGKKDKDRGTEQVYICITDIRRRLTDDDNLCEKFTVDCLRRYGVLKDDSVKFARIFTTQRKCEKGEDPHTLIEIF